MAKHKKQIPVALTIAGSDSGAGAGIQADLKTFESFKVFGTSAITCVTAQNPETVNGIQAVDPALVNEQIRTVCEGFPIAAAKTGMLYSAGIILSVVKAIQTCGIKNIVVDPVMIATSGARLIHEEAVEIMLGKLFPLATVIIPNIPEAEVILRHQVKTLHEMKNAAISIGTQYNCACIIKGGHLPGNKAIDILYYQGKTIINSSTKVKAEETHGTGCAFSAAITAMLAKGYKLPEAFKKAKAFIISALKKRVQVGTHYPLNL